MAKSAFFLRCIAQLVEHSNHNRVVGGSIPSIATSSRKKFRSCEGEIIFGICSVVEEVQMEWFATT